MDTKNSRRKVQYLRYREKITKTYQETETKKNKDLKKSKTHRSKKFLFIWIDRRKESLRHKDSEVYYET